MDLCSIYVVIWQLMAVCDQVENELNTRLTQYIMDKLRPQVSEGEIKMQGFTFRQTKEATIFWCIAKREEVHRKKLNKQACTHKLVAGRIWEKKETKVEICTAADQSTKELKMVLKKIWTISRFVRVILAQGPC